MADPHVLSALQNKAHELRAAIVTYEESLERNRQELAVVTAAITIFQRDGGRITDTRLATVRNLFKRGEVLAICKARWRTAPEGMTTRDLGVACLVAREFTHEYPVLLRAMVGLLSNTLKKAGRRGEMVSASAGGRRKEWRIRRRYEKISQKGIEQCQLGAEV